MQGYRAALLRFDDADRARRLDDGLMLVEAGRIASSMCMCTSRSSM